MTCPARAIRPFARGAGAAGLTVVAELCTGCLECIEICPADAIEETLAIEETAVIEERIEERQWT